MLEISRFPISPYVNVSLNCDSTTGARFFLFFFSNTLTYNVFVKKIIAVRPSAEAVRENSELLEYFFLVCFSYGGPDFLGGHIFC
jgi:hypothetical protein